MEAVGVIAHSVKGKLVDAQDEEEEGQEDDEDFYEDEDDEGDDDEDLDESVEELTGGQVVVNVLDNDE